MFCVLRSVVPTLRKGAKGGAAPGMVSLEISRAKGVPAPGMRCKKMSLSLRFTSMDTT